ncbi:hypothetical protein CRUP_018850, partial [Coryphaenoides rupestris]
VQANRKRCHRVAERVRALEELVTAIREGSTAKSSAPQVESVLEKLKLTLHLAEDLVRKYVDAHVLKRVARAYQLGEDFGDVNERLNDAYQELTLAVQVQQGHAARRAFDAAERRAQDELDRREDGEELLRILQDTQATVTQTHGDVQDLRTTIEKLIEN